MAKQLHVMTLCKPCKMLMIKIYHNLGVGIVNQVHLKLMSQTLMMQVQKRIEFNFNRHILLAFEQKEKQNLVIPIQFSLLNDKLVPLMLGDSGKEQITLELVDTQQSPRIYKRRFNANSLHCSMVFSAPVKLNYPYSQQQLSNVMLGSPDEFARWDAGQKLFSDCIHKLANKTEQQQLASITQTVLMFEPIFEAKDISLALKTEMLTLPSFETLFQQMDSVDIEVLSQSRKQLLKALAKTFQVNWLSHYSAFEKQPYKYQSKQVEQRKMRNLALKYLTLSEQPDVEQLLIHQFDNADNMTDSLGVLGAAQFWRSDFV